MAELGIAVVTVAGSGIGYATATRVTGTDSWSRRSTSTPRGSRGWWRGAAAATTHVLDVRGAAGFERLLAGLPGLPAASRERGGVGVAAVLHETEPDDRDRVLGLKLTALFPSAAQPPRGWSGRGGLIVNVASVAGLVGVRNRAPYCASKPGDRAQPLGRGRLRAARVPGDAFCPGTVETEWIDKMLANAPDPVAARRAMEERQLDGRMGTPEEIAGAIAYLLRPDARASSTAAPL